MREECSKLVMSVCVHQLGMLLRTNEHSGMAVDVSQILITMKDESRVCEK